MYSRVLQRQPFPQSGIHQRERIENILVIMRNECSLAWTVTWHYYSMLWTSHAIRFVLALWIYIFFGQKSCKGTLEHQFLPETSKSEVRPCGAWMTAVLRCAARNIKGFFTFIAVMKEQPEHKRGLDSCPPSLLPAFFWSWLYVFWVEDSLSKLKPPVAESSWSTVHIMEGTMCS